MSGAKEERCPRVWKSELFFSDDKKFVPPGESELHLSKRAKKFIELLKDELSTVFFMTPFVLYQNIDFKRDWMD